VDKQDLIQEIRELIINNQTERALERLSTVQFNKVDKELIILTSQYKRVQEDILMNTISREEAERKINGINKALLELSERVDRSEKNPADLSGSPLGQRQWWPLLLLPVLALIIYFSMGNDKSVGEATTGENGNNPSPTVVNQDSIDQAKKLKQQRIADSLEEVRLELDNQAKLQAEQRRRDSIRIAEIESEEQDRKASLEAETKKGQSEAATPPPPQMMKVKFILRKLEVIKDGDGPFDGAGDFTWEFRLNGKVIEENTKEYGMDDGEERTFNVERTIEIPLEGGELKFDAVINENDSGGTGDDDIITINSGAGNKWLRGLKIGKRDNASNLGTHPDGKPQVRVHWSVTRLQ
jgi:hypothetical protein